MAAPGQQKAFIKGGLDCSPQVDARLRSTRTLADIRRPIDADDDHGFSIPLTQAPGDNADHAGVPEVVGGGDDGLRLGIQIGLPVDQRRGFLGHLAFNFPPLNIQRIEFRRHGRGLVDVVGGQQSRSQNQACRYVLPH